MRKVTLLSKLLIIGATFAIIFVLFYSFEPSYKLTDDPQVRLPPQVPKVSVDSIFGEQNDIDELEDGRIITLTATGDVIPARGANWPAVTSGDFTYNWKKTSSLLKKGDITLINLEAPLIENCPLMTEGLTFCGDDRHIEGIVFAGVDTVSIANNHIGNYGRGGIDETITLLETNKVGWSGFSNLDIRRVQESKFGFLAFNGIGTSINRKSLAKEIKEARPKVDFLIVSVHWGDEYVLIPRRYGDIAPDEPREIGHLIIDSGADLIIGNHPHTVQGVEIYNDKLITYAHGNFIFDQTWSQETQEGVVGEYTFYLSSEVSAKGSEIHLVNAKFHPILVDKSYQPRLLNQTEGQHILDRMLKSSKTISKN